MYLWRSAFFSHSSLRKVSRKVSRKPKILSRMWMLLLFLFTLDKLLSSDIVTASAESYLYSPRKGGVTRWYHALIIYTLRSPYDHPTSSHVFVATNICHDKIFCRDKHNFVAASIHLSRKIFCLSRQTNIILSRQAYFCRDKHVFVATKMTLVAALASDKVRPGRSHGEFNWARWQVDCRNWRVEFIQRPLSKAMFFSVLTIKEVFCLFNKSLADMYLIE